MKKQIIFALLWLLAMTASAQPKNAHCPAPNSTNRGKATVVDTTLLRVMYALNADRLDDERTYMAALRLDIGRRVTKHYGYFTHRSDSLIAAWRKKNPRAQSCPKFLGNGGKKQGTWSEIEYSDLYFEGGQMTEYCPMPLWLERYNAWFSEPRPKQDWTLCEDTLTILGYRCQKAVCHWRGRDFVAWFAREIPARYGPWKFGGLPGLILRLHDSARLYRFEAVELSREHAPITRHEYKGYSKSTRAKVWEQQRKFNENWFKASGFRKATIDAHGNMVPGEAVSKHTPYEQLEKE